LDCSVLAAVVDDACVATDDDDDNDDDQTAVEPTAVLVVAAAAAAIGIVFFVRVVGMAVQNRQADDKYRNKIRRRERDASWWLVMEVCILGRPFGSVLHDDDDVDDSTTSMGVIESV
jgi:hypothetical protein